MEDQPIPAVEVKYTWTGRQAIVTRYHPHTNHRAARISATSFAGRTSTRAEDGSWGNQKPHLDAAKAHAAKFEWDSPSPARQGDWYGAGLPDGDNVWVWVPRA